MELTTDVAELRRLLALLREEGVTHYRSGDLELRLGPVPREDEEEVQSSENTSDPVRDPLANIPENYRRAFGVKSLG
jgi:hypothetical protein